MKGILFKPDMIQAVIERRKTVTRRVIKLQSQNPYDVWYKNGIFTYRDKINYEGGCYFSEWQHIKPRYQVGEIVYIKEAWSDIYCWAKEKVHVLYALEYPPAPRGFKWKSPFFMPESAARHFIFIEGVRAERLQEITEEDCIAEGMKQQELPYDIAPVWQYQELWDSINPAYPFDSNPWVWAYQFRLLSPENL